MSRMRPSGGYRDTCSFQTAKTGKNAVKQFWGCPGYPDCKGAVNL